MLDYLTHVHALVMTGLDDNAQFEEMEICEAVSIRPRRRGSDWYGNYLQESVAAICQILNEKTTL
jgi:hypothetical protein